MKKDKRNKYNSNEKKNIVAEMLILFEELKLVVNIQDYSGLYYVDYLLKTHDPNFYQVYNTLFRIEEIKSITVFPNQHIPITISLIK